TDTQALYYDEVTLIKSKGDMHYVAAKDQYVPYNKNGYPGWVGKNQIVKSNLNTDDCQIAIVTADKTTLLNEKNKQSFLQISYATILPVIKEEQGYYYVQTPANGVKLLKKNAAKVYKDYKSVPKPSKSDIVNTAKRFLGLPYLWAGTSSWGYDCSGIIYAAYRAHGIMIPRDSFYQATKGKAISKSKLQPGDLVFFAYNGGTGKVYHVGLYIGNGQMLHAPHYAAKVRIERLDSGVYKRNYSGARRYL
ncbi:MAG: C40 family peptidase, partial [Lysinibacillus sp.]